MIDACSLLTLVADHLAIPADVAAEAFALWMISPYLGTVIAFLTVSS